jgi:hypothetical protein
MTSFPAGSQPGHSQDTGSGRTSANLTTDAGGGVFGVRSLVALSSGGQWHASACSWQTVQNPFES